MNGSACHFHSSQASDALLLRLYGPLNDVKKDIIGRYSSQVRDTVDLWTLYDVTLKPPEEVSRILDGLKELQARLESPFSIFLYDREFLYRVFPTVSPQRLEAIDVNRYVHDISILSWWRVCGQHNWGDNDRVDPTEITPRNVWVVEADAGFSGNVTFFLDFYKDTSYDLISSTVGNVVKGESFVARLGVEGAFWLQSVRGDHYTSTFPAERFYAKNDFVNRFSSRLLYHLEAVVIANVIFFGEIFAPTVCAGMYSNWCTYHSFNDDGFGGEVLVWNGQISLESWEKYNQEPEHQNRWYHAVSKFKDHRRVLCALLGSWLQRTFAFVSS